MIEYQETRPSVVILLIDNYDEVMRGVKESEKAQVLGAIETILERFVTENKCLLRKMDSRDKFLAVIEERYMRQLTENRFKILDEMRSIATGDRTPITFSIGVGAGRPDLVESERMASQALEMALGRAVTRPPSKPPPALNFTVACPRASKSGPRSRLVSLPPPCPTWIENADNVLIMGHRGRTWIAWALPWPGQGGALPAQVRLCGAAEKPQSGGSPLQPPCPQRHGGLLSGAGDRHGVGDAADAAHCGGHPQSHLPGVAGAVCRL